MCAARSSSDNRWYPVETRLTSPKQINAVLKQVLDLHYALQDKYDALQTEHSALKNGAMSASRTPPGSGPSDTMILGLRVLPIDVQTLADGTKLTFVKAQGHFEFK